MTNYCKECCEKVGIKFDIRGKTCWVGMTCDLCGKVLHWADDEFKGEE